MEDVLTDIFKFSLYICLSYIMGIAARIWWEIKFLLLWVIGFIFLGLLPFWVFMNESLSIGQDIQVAALCALIFIPFGYTTGHAAFERFLTSNAFDPTYRKYAKRNKKKYSAEDLDAFYNHFKSKRGSSTSYEQYSQYRRSQKRSNSHMPPPQDYTSDKVKMFDILEVKDKSASSKDLKSAYRKLARKYHPDILASNDLSETELKAAEQRMQEINQAYDWLEDNGFA